MPLILKKIDLLLLVDSTPASLIPLLSASHQLLPCIRCRTQLYTFSMDRTDGFLQISVCHHFNALTSCHSLWSFRKPTKKHSTFWRPATHKPLSIVLFRLKVPFLPLVLASHSLFQAFVRCKSKTALHDEELQAFSTLSSYTFYTQSETTSFVTLKSETVSISETQIEA